MSDTRFVFQLWSVITRAPSVKYPTRHEVWAQNYILARKKLFVPPFGSYWVDVTDLPEDIPPYDYTLQGDKVATKKQKREAGRQKAEKDLQDSIASGLAALAESRRIRAERKAQKQAKGEEDDDE